MVVRALSAIAGKQTILNSLTPTCLYTHSRDHTSFPLRLPCAMILIPAIRRSPDCSTFIRYFDWRAV